MIEGRMSAVRRNLLSVKRVVGSSGLFIAQRATLPAVWCAGLLATLGFRFKLCFEPIETTRMDCC